MRTKLFIVYLAAVVLLQQSYAENRIHRGTDASQGEFPGFVSLSVPGSPHSCGGSILDQDHIITAAHCFWDREATDIQVLPQYNVRYPTANDVAVNSTRVERKCLSPNYISAKIGYDYAILKLSTPLDLGDSSMISAIDLPTRPISYSEVGFAVGYGYTDNDLQVDPDILQKAEVERHNCSAASSNPSKICFCGLDKIAHMRHGDSGGPVLVKEGGHKQTIYGITSYGEGICPDFFVDVYNLREEIKKMLVECV